MVQSRKRQPKPDASFGLLGAGGVEGAGVAATEAVSILRALLLHLVIRHGGGA